MIYIISDTHFGHKNIIRYCDRPYLSAEEMDKALINNWQKTVSPSDTVIHVGDFAFAKLARRQEILAQLPGTKVLVRGNHDYGPEEMLESGFNVVVESMTIEVGGVKYLISHHPIDPDMARLEILDSIGAAFHIHGHVHNKTPLYYAERSINVSCENTDYTPFQLRLLPHAYEESKP